MKRLLENIKSSLILLSIFASFGVLAKGPMALVNSVKGNAFVIKKGGKTHQLVPGDHLFDFDEVMTETGGQITFSDYHDHQYHLSGSGHVLVMNRTVDLKRGYLWLQSFGKGEQFMVQTPNAVTHYEHGEGIVSFDPYSGKTQLLVMKGNMEFANNIENIMKTDVREGQFSFIEKDYEQGRPRRPTPVGFSSFSKVTGLFKGVKPIEGDRAIEKMRSKPTVSPTQRSIASVNLKSWKEEEKEVDKKNDVEHPNGDIIYLVDDPQKKAQKRQSLLNYYNSKVTELKKPKAKPKFKPTYSGKSAVPMKVFGKKRVKRSKSKTKVEKKAAPSNRAPASIPAVKPATMMKRSTKAVGSDPFEKTLVKEYKKQMRHSQEKNQLIDELKNYSQDYQISY